MPRGFFFLQHRATFPPFTSTLNARSRYTGTKEKAGRQATPRRRTAQNGFQREQAARRPIRPQADAHHMRRLSLRSCGSPCACRAASWNGAAPRWLYWYGPIEHIGSDDSFGRCSHCMVFQRLFALFRCHNQAKHHPYICLAFVLAACCSGTLPR